MDYMVGFYLSKPLQGSKFWKFRATIMKIPEDTTNYEIEYLYINKMRNWHMSINITNAIPQ